MLFFKKRKIEKLECKIAGLQAQLKKTQELMPFLDQLNKHSSLAVYDLIQNLTKLPQQIAELQEQCNHILQKK